MKALSVLFLAVLMTGCSINVVVAPHAVLKVHSTDAGTLQELNLPGE